MNVNITLFNYPRLLMMPSHPSSASAAIDLIADDNELRSDYVALPTEKARMTDVPEFMKMTHETHGKMAAVIDTIRGAEDGRFPREPQKKVNRLALLEASTAPESIQKSYDLYEVLPGLETTAPSIRLRIQQLLGYMNNYDPYINIRGVLARKQALLEKYCNGESSNREQRFAVIAAQAMDILTLQKEQEFDDKKPQGETKMMHGYAQAYRIAKEFLVRAGAEETFDEMGFTLGEKFADYQPPEGHPPAARVTSLSGKDREIAFITIHQIFETYFEEALGLLKKISACKTVDHVDSQDIDDVTLLLDTSNRYFDVLKNLLSKSQFDAMRNSFGIASGAQSQQYHLIENYIGYPGAGERRQRRLSGLQHLLGSKNIEAIKEEIPAEKSLKERFGKEERLHGALRALNLALLDFKAIHGRAMLQYLSADTPGSGGTEITVFFAKGMGAVFPVFTSEEIVDLEAAIQEVIYVPSKPGMEGKDSDSFKAVLAFVQRARQVS